MRSMVSMGKGGRPPKTGCAPGDEWGNGGHQRCSEHQLVHLIEKDLLAGLLGQWAQAQGY